MLALENFSNCWSKVNNYSPRRKITPTDLPTLLKKILYIYIVLPLKDLFVLIEKATMQYLEDILGLMDLYADIKQMLPL